jgi:ParB-like chromosome segregation protein Spo0J
MDVIDLPLERLIPYARNPRKNAAAVGTVAASLKEFGWRQPIVVDEAMVILAGHTRLEAARQLGLTSVPVHVARGLTPAQAKAYRLTTGRPRTPSGTRRCLGSSSATCRVTASTWRSPASTTRS